MTPRDRDEIAAIRARLAASPRPEGWDARRARIDDVGAIWPVADDVALAGVMAGGVAAEWSIAQGSAPDRVLIYFHGGGYCSGSIVSHRRLVTEAGRAAGARTLAVAYRLAPEYPHPAALDDALAAWTWLRAQGIAADAIAIGGDSAGGGLALVLLMRLRALGEPLPACAWLLSPWTDLTLSAASLDSRDAADPLIHRSYLDELAGAYVPASVDRREPAVSPLFGKLAGLPPLLIQVGSAETLLDDATRLAAAAGAADVAVTLEIWPHMIHAWPMWNGGLEAGRRALRQAGAFLTRHWPGT